MMTIAVVYQFIIVTVLEKYCLPQSISLYSYIEYSLHAPYKCNPCTWNKAYRSVSPDLIADQKNEVASKLLLIVNQKDLA